ncbi:MAG: divalent metal cation transporter, partial [Verrucomicrobiota bacterium]
MKKTLAPTISKAIALFLPGIFLLGFNIGTGSVTAMAKSGATYGMSLLWTVVASCLTTYFLISIYGRMTLVTGETALASFRRHIHPAVGVLCIGGHTPRVFGRVIGVMGVIAEICDEWS